MGKKVTTRRCSDCGNDFPADVEMLAKKAEWRSVANPNRVIRTRTVKHQCPDCAAKDCDWQREIYKGSPAYGGR